MHAARRIMTVTIAGCLVTTVAACTANSSATKTSASSSPKPSGSSAQGLSAVPGIVNEVAPSVVTITTPIGLGSGVVFDANGIIVTDAHVVEDQSKKPFSTVQVQFADGKTVSAQVLGVDDVTDVAVINADRKKLPVPTFSSAEPVVGQMCVVIGSPLGLEETATAGIISGLHRNMPPSNESPEGLIDLLQTDAPISPGNSGGAAVDGNGHIIGLSEAYIPPSQGAVAIGFVTPASIVTDVAKQLIKTGHATHAFIGIQPLAITSQLAQRYNLPTTGVLVAEVTSGGPAQKAGIEQGDVITSFGGTKIKSVTDLLAAVRSATVGKQVTVVIDRNGKSKSVTLTVTESP